MKVAFGSLALAQLAAARDSRSQVARSAPVDQKVAVAGLAAARVKSATAALVRTRPSPHRSMA